MGEKLLGIGRVSLILDISNNIIWQNGQNGRELTFYLYDFVAEDISVGVLPGAPPLATAQIGFTGGVVEIYSQAVGTFDPSGTQAAGVTSATAGNLFLTLAGSAVGGFGSVSGAPLTLTSLATNATNGDPLLDSLNLSGQAFFDVTGGPAASNFDTNAFGCIAANGLPCPNSADVKPLLRTACSTNVVGWGFRGTGEAASLVIPEPGTLALLGVGLAGFGYRVRRKQD
ncbi:MAG: PEP-CTERM sorting domain-containing protein [Betaproteobacteria bacterium]|nr:PEP-CTERM sorting domain-containing protein [Betaproteobacteria bacterium]